MRIFYKIWLTDNSPAAEILSFAFCSDLGNKLYAEMNDVTFIDISDWHRDNIYHNFYGKDGFKEIIPIFPKLKACEVRVTTAKDRLADFLKQYPFLELVGHSNYYEVQALHWLLDWDNEPRHINIINISDDMIEKYNEVFGAIKGDLPENNALRLALGFKYLSAKL